MTCAMKGGGDKAKEVEIQRGMWNFARVRNGERE